MGYRELAADLRRRINEGEFAVGDTLPKITDLMSEYGLARQTVRDAIALLTDEGLVVSIRKRGTLIRGRTPVRIPLSRYQRVLAPGGTRGPWETATAEQGLDGHMTLVKVEHVAADDTMAALLELAPGDRLVHRVRHAAIRPDDIVQLQLAWYPAALAEAAGLATAEKIEGGIYGALAAAGRRPATVSETVRARLPLDTEATQLRIGGRIWVLAIERVTRDAEGRPLEALRVVAPADRVELAYDDLPLAQEEKR
ncbi:GntR family transcriptional regulator [Streptomyces sp. B1866]|uniref:GntR family transcriptional regulator n=1 Tax=Streptomyces sp. B1866 TaxID=3075431 RepID=UPI00288DE835|nr:GntR family transcriptional regulator [Streptomyces sp. B1866]MDT3396814.1 GntR family transcriptional regulator [Streptomyces sp. B1866]